MALILSVLEQGMIYGILALGVYITYKILDFPDLTVDGSFPFGAAVTVRLISLGIPAVVTLPVAFLGGALVGMCTGLIHVKLKAKKNKGGFNQHNLISAFCELSLMNTFIVRSSNRSSFKYEDKCVEGSDKNVEFSIKMGEFTFHVEVKTSDLLMEDRNIVKALHTSDEVLVLDARNRYFKEIKEKAKIPVIGSLDNRLVDYLESANEKFSKSDDEYEVNLLVICWDDRIHQPLLALKSEDAEGILTNQTHLKNEDGSNKQFENVDCILINSGYCLFKEYIGFILFDRFSPQFPVDPFFQLFTYNYLIDHNLSEDRVNMIQSIIQQKVIILDENYAQSLPPVSVAFMKDKASNVISFRNRNIKDFISI